MLYDRSLAHINSPIRVAELLPLCLEPLQDAGDVLALRCARVATLLRLLDLRLLDLRLGLGLLKVVESGCLCLL